MSSIGIKAALKEVEKLGIQSMDVPEWETTIFWNPLSPEKISKIVKLDQRLMNSTLIVEHALDKNKKRLFEAGDQFILSKNGNFKTIARIANIMLGDPEDREETVKDPLG